MYASSDVIALGALVVSVCALIQSYTSNKIAKNAPLTQVEYQERRDKIVKLWELLDEMTEGLLALEYHAKQSICSTDYLDEVHHKKQLSEKYENYAKVYEATSKSLYTCSNRNIFEHQQRMLLADLHFELMELWHEFTKKCIWADSFEEAPSCTSFYFLKTEVERALKV